MSQYGYTNKNWIGLVLLTLLCVYGCTGQTSPTDIGGTNAEPEVSEYPLRLWIVANVTDVSQLERQWLAGSNQRIEVQILQPAELLQQSTCDCDLLIFPSRLTGEMVHRKWVVRLPVAVFDSDQALDGESAISPPAADTQTFYGGTKYALSLGCSVLAPIASESLAAQLPTSPVSWTQVIELLNMDPKVSLPADTAIDRQALVDRFLTIVASLTDRNPNYGLLFELQTMTPRLTKPEFVEAGSILKSLSLQRGGVQALVGSHDAAWGFVTQHDGPVVAIASPAMLNSKSTGLKTGKSVEISSKGKLTGWNGGSGLVAALAADCRQTSATINMLKWLRQRKTRDSIAAFAQGVESISPESGADSLSWRVRTELASALGNANLPQEPRLRSAENYRDALAEALMSIINEKMTVEEALSDAAAAWITICKQSGYDVQADYEKSLGLTL